MGLHNDNASAPTAARSNTLESSDDDIANEKEGEGVKSATAVSPQEVV